MAAVEVTPPFTTPASADAETLAELEAVRRLLHRLRLDIHDGALQELAVVSNDLFLLRDELQAERRRTGVEMPALERVDTVARRVDGVIDDLRDLAVAARRSLRVQRPLAATIRRAAELYAGTYELDLLVQVDPETLTETQRITIERVVQTALANVAQHSGATVASVAVVGTAEGTVVEIADDGCGFDVQACMRRSASRGRLGLLAVVDRVHLLGGSVEIDSAPGGPTRIRALLPPVAAPESPVSSLARARASRRRRSGRLGPGTAAA
jgi:signal transduction histidine kinase